MRKMFLSFNDNRMYSPVEDSSIGVDEMVDLLGGDDNPDEDKDKVVTDTEGVDLLLKDDKEPEKEEKEFEKEEKELELEEKEPEVEELDDDVVDVSRKELLTAYPDLFKKFPSVEKAIYRERAYTEIFPTVADAKAANESVEQFKTFESAILSGDLSSVLTAAKEADANIFTKTVDNYLTDLKKVDNDAYFHVLSNTIRSTIGAMVTEADRIKNDDLKAAAVILNQFIFGNSEYRPPSNFSKGKITEESDEQKKFKQERQQYDQERYDDAVKTLDTKTTNILRHTVTKNIDPKDSMTDYVKNVAIDKCLREVDNLISSDKRFMTQMEGLWTRAAKEKFSKSSLDAIERAWTNKAKTLLPDVIKKSRNEALKGLGKRVTEDKQEPEKKGHIAARRSADSKQNGNKGNSVPKGMKTIDFLNSD